MLLTLNSFGKLPLPKQSIRGEATIDIVDGKVCGHIRIHHVENVERAITTDASLVVAHDSDNILKTRFERVLEKPNEPPLLEVNTSGSREGSMEHTFELMDIVPPIPHDLPLLRGNTPGSDEGRMELI
ncbi:hypothetical protein Tco_1005075 [Tanacetum coccineum]|uniref:Uncharacterized protein n=1 Tax=Tanacetum coccineum TaxID=301880 RepID=A0ABQ5FFK8_9ASTR